jgi:hypothetical protein
MTIPKHIGPQPDHGNGRRLHRTRFPDVGIAHLVRRTLSRS